MNTVKLTHLGQMHRLPFGIKPSPEIANQIVESQIKVANYIKEHPNALVFQEGQTENLLSVPFNDMTFFVRDILFPQGIPDDISKMNAMQKEFLSTYGESMAPTLLRMGELKALYRTNTPKEFNAIHREAQEGYLKALMGPKEEAEERSLRAVIKNSPKVERAAMECMQEVLKHNPNAKEVIIVFGDKHDFSMLCKEYGFEHEKISCLADDKPKEPVIDHNTLVANIVKNFCAKYIQEKNRFAAIEESHKKSIKALHLGS